MMSKRWLIPVVLFLGTLAWLLIAPPRFWLNLTKHVDLTNPVTAGEELVHNYDCRSCHRIDAQGALMAPDLNGVTIHVDRETLIKWLEAPRSIRSGTAMPNFKLSDSEITAIIAYLESLDNQ